MWLNQLMSGSPVDFEKRCRTRMKVGAGFVLLGAMTMGVTALQGGSLPARVLEAEAVEFMAEYYAVLGIALIAAGGALIVKNMRYLKNPELLKKGQVAEDDERNRLLGLRCWAYTGYAMFLVLYVGMLIGGFISPTVVVVLQTVLAVYALLLLVFRTILARCM